jgi:hypothetical protein
MGEETSLSSSSLLMTKRDDSIYVRSKLVQLGVSEELLNQLNDVQRKELLKSMLYLIVKKQDGY